MFLGAHVQDFAQEDSKVAFIVMGRQELTLSWFSRLLESFILVQNSIIECFDLDLDE